MDGWVPLTLIRGQHQVIGAAPDGDSVRFTPTDPRAWARAGVAARVNATGGAQLRLDGIDAHETHHTPRGGTRRRQPAALGGAAADRLLELHGFAGVTRTAGPSATETQPRRSWLVLRIGPGFRCDSACWPRANLQRGH